MPNLCLIFRQCLIYNTHRVLIVLFKMKICGILGHRKIENTIQLKNAIELTLRKLIVKNNVRVFLFGSKSAFNDLCYEIISALKNEFKDLQRIYVRAEYPYVNEDYEAYLKTFYEESYYYDKEFNSNKYNYVKRNKLIIDKSDICIFYYNFNYVLEKKTNSGTKTEYDYAIKKNKRIINLYNQNDANGC